MKRSNKSKPSVSFDASVFQPKSNQEINETDITSAISDKIERKDTFSYKSRVKLSTHDLRVTIKTNKTKNSYTEVITFY